MRKLLVYADFNGLNDIDLLENLPWTASVVVKMLKNVVKMLFEGYD